MTANRPIASAPNTARMRRGTAVVPGLRRGLGPRAPRGGGRRPGGGGGRVIGPQGSTEGGDGPHSPPGAATDRDSSPLYDRFARAGVSNRPNFTPGDRYVGSVATNRPNSHHVCTQGRFGAFGPRSPA